MRSPVNLWVIGGAILVALALLGATLGVIWFTRPAASAKPPATANLNVITAPTQTPLPPTQAPATTPTPDQPTPLPGQIGIGSTIQVSGTGGDGLRIRLEPGLQSQAMILGAEGEAFTVKDGPREADGYTWWYLVGANDPSRKGWAVANFLALAQ